MRGVMFPNSNIIFTVQTHDPAEKKNAGDTATVNGGFNWTMWGSDLYSGWEIVDYAAVALAESAPLMLTPGRRCENGKPVSVNDPDWIRFTKEMAEVGRAAYRASRPETRRKASDISGDVAEPPCIAIRSFAINAGAGPRVPILQRKNCVAQKASGARPEHYPSTRVDRKATRSARVNRLGSAVPR